MLVSSNKNIFFANSSNVCHSYKVVDGRVQRKVADRLHNDHEEADCRIYHFAKTNIRMSATDCLIIAHGLLPIIRSIIKIIDKGCNQNYTPLC